MVFEKTDLYYRKYAINIVQFNYFSEANGMSIGRKCATTHFQPMLIPISVYTSIRQA